MSEWTDPPAGYREALAEQERPDKPKRERPKTLNKSEAKAHEWLRMWAKHAEPLKLLWYTVSIDPPDASQNGVWIVPSLSDPELIYFVTLDPKVCQCKGFERHQDCIHVQAVARRTVLMYRKPVATIDVEDLALENRQASVASALDEEGFW